MSRGQKRDLDYCYLREIVDAAMESVDTQGAKVQLAVSIDEALEVFGDRTRIERVFTNLLANALEAMPEGGVIEIQSCQAGNVVDVFVEDSGPGIPCGDAVTRVPAIRNRQSFGPRAWAGSLQADDDRTRRQPECDSRAQRERRLLLRSFRQDTKK